MSKHDDQQSVEFNKVAEIAKAIGYENIGKALVAMACFDKDLNAVTALNNIIKVKHEQQSEVMQKLIVAATQATTKCPIR